MTRTANNGKTGETATVEVLAAEVRVLLVAGRQVTLSVYRQLDHMAPRYVEPFGRVNDGRSTTDAIWVVGRDRRDGALVKSAHWIGWRLKIVDDCVVVGPSDHIGDLTEDPWETYTRAHSPDAALRDLLDHVRDRSVMWADLPLIVLAGLR